MSNTYVSSNDSYKLESTYNAYKLESPPNGYKLESPCNAHCHCTVLSFAPVCYEDNTQFFSGCHAGCTDAAVVNDSLVGIPSITNNNLINHLTHSKNKTDLF